MASTTSEEVVTTPATSATPFDRPTWEGRPAFQDSANLNPTHSEDYADIGDNWGISDPFVIDHCSSSTPGNTQSGFKFESSWGTGPPVEIPIYNTHFTVLSSMDQRSGRTHYLLLSNRGFLFHGHHPTVEWKALQTLHGDGAEFACLPMHVVPASYLFPAHQPWMQKFAGDEEDADVFVKSQAFLARERYRSDHHARATYQEVSRCEVIAQSPHSNLARYLGVQTKMFGEEERVVSIAYQRYSMDLHEFVLMKRLLLPRHVPLVIRGIERGMRHLHGLGLIHCDLRPMNVFVTIGEEKGEDGGVVLKEIVIGDFDASVMIGEKISLKRANNEWWPPEIEWDVKAGEWVDEWCLEKMKNWLKEGAGMWEWASAATISPPPNTTGCVPIAVLEGSAAFASATYDGVW
ncbi:ATP binding [Ascochyta rabiei]|uniref:EKC/KEOPS complex subunit BUD32 n=2 Tax=Didymella rabiei TaxID=5454 RepID=A0A162ZQ05_DIDRA|nr:ATP binding [Ascochyta rabiei]